MNFTDVQLTRIMNWLGLGLGLLFLVIVALDIFNRNLLQDPLSAASGFQFSDLPGQSSKPLTAGVDQIVARNIFGVKRTPPAPRPVVKAAPPPEPVAQQKPPLKVKITGLIEGSSPETGMAMMEVSGKSAVVAVGEKIGTTGAVLTKVHSSSIEVDRGGGSIQEIQMKRNSIEIKIEKSKQPSSPSGDALKTA